MTQIAKLYAQAIQSRGLGISFRDFERLLRAFSFVEKRRHGSHRTWRHSASHDLLVIQPHGKQAMPYQIRAFLDIVRDCGLTLED